METEKVTNKPHIEREKNKHQRPNPTDLNDSKDQLPDLPSEIIIDILSRLDVKSLLRFRCVQKSWASLVSNPKFVNTHMIHHSMKSHNIVMGLTTSDRNSCTFLHSIFDNPYFSNMKLDFVQENFLVNGSCNGLLCLVTCKDIYLWNPLTRESRRLPRFQLSDCNSLFKNRLGNWGVYGFGYDYSKSDYKVVFHCHEFRSSVRTRAHIYSLRTNSWRRIDPTYRGVLLGKHSKCINGIIHWVSRPLRSFYPSSIISIDFAKETYGEIAEPIYGHGSWLWSLGELEGSLCLLTDNSENRADVWIMKEYGVNESWTKLFSIAYAEKPGLFRHHENITPLLVSISKNGKIELEGWRDLVLYSNKDKTFTYFLNYPCQSNCNINTFGESLVSPNAYNK